MIQKIFNYLYRTTKGRNLLHIIIGALIALSCVLTFKMDGYRPFYVILFVTIIGLIWEAYHWKVSKAVFDKGDIFRADLGAIIVLLINSLIQNLL